MEDKKRRDRQEEEEREKTRVKVEAGTMVGSSDDHKRKADSQDVDEGGGGRDKRRVDDQDVDKSGVSGSKRKADAQDVDSVEICEVVNLDSWVQEVVEGMEDGCVLNEELAWDDFHGGDLPIEV